MGAARTWALILLCGLANPPAAGADEGAHGPALADGIGPLDPWRAADGEPERLLALSALGPLKVRTTPIPWGRIEPAPPSATGAAYEWGALDQALVRWQLAGLEPVLVLTPANAWAGVPLDRSAWTRRLLERDEGPEVEAWLRAGVGVTGPRPERWADWERFVRAVVERYDGDGVTDAPGLRRPIHYFQILERFDRPAAFAGDAADVLRLLHHAGLGAASAWAGARIVLGGFDLQALGHAPLPPPDVLAVRRNRALPETPVLARLEAEEAYARIDAVLGMPRLYHALLHVGSGHPADDESNLGFLAAWREEHGAMHVELWLGEAPDAPPERPLTPGAPQLSVELRRRLARLKAAAQRPEDPEHGLARRWLGEAAALGRLRTALAARGAGAEVVFHGRPWGGPKPLLEPAGAGGGWRPTASFHWLSQWLRRIGPASAERLPAPAGQRAILFRRGARGGSAWVQVHAWRGHVLLAPYPGEGGPSANLALALPPGRYRVQGVQLGPAEPESRVGDAAEGVLLTALGPLPLYLWPEP